MRYVLLYEPGPDVATLAPRHFAAHVGRYQQFVADGTLLLIGTFEDAAADGAMAVFTTRAAAEAFAAGDPFVTEGVVSRWRVLGWNEVLSPPPTAP